MTITDTTHGAPAGQRLARTVRTIFFIVAAVAVIAGPAYWINGLTQPLVRVEAPVARAVPLGDQVTIPAGTPARATIIDRDGGGTTDLRPVTKILWRSDRLALGLAVAGGAFLLGQLTGAISEGRPFDRRNPRRMGLVAICVAAGGTIPEVLAGSATAHALDDAGLAAGGALRAGGGLDLTPLFIAAAILVLAQAFREGTRVTQDVEGLV